MNTNDSFNQTKTVTARIVSVHKNRFQIALDSAERKAAEHDAVLAGRLLYRGEIPVVGDYIEAEFETSPVGKPVGDARIVSILPRKSLITRPEYRVGTQNMAANVDICFLVVSANADFSVNRIARYASAVLQGGSKPVVVLTKADLCSDLSEYMHRINEICGNIQMHCVSSKTGVGIDELRQYLVPGTTIGLFGSSGVGKSTLIKMLMEEEYPDEGKIKFGPSVRTAYLPQIVTFDVPERNLVDTMLYSKRNITPQTARDRLAAFHFTGEDVFKSVSVLSGGELSRLKLCILMDEEVNLLILDEPTNHLDIASREWIEEAVESYDGTLLFVSHDRYFINRFATRVWELENGVITDYPMGFARYRQVKALEAQNKIDHTPKAVKEKTVTEKPKPNRSAQQARRQLTICEKEISAQEAAIAEIEQRLEEAGSDYERYSEIYKEKEAAEETLGALMEKWESLAEQAGE